MRWSTSAWWATAASGATASAPPGDGPDKVRIDAGSRDGVGRGWWAAVVMMLLQVIYA